MPSSETSFELVETSLSLRLVMKLVMKLVMSLGLRQVMTLGLRRVVSLVASIVSGPFMGVVMKLRLRLVLSASRRSFVLF